MVDQPNKSTRKVDFASPLTFRNAFWFPVQDRAARIDVLIGALLFFIPIIGFALNMGFRLHIVHNLLMHQSKLPSWSDWRTMLRHGLLTTVVILGFHTPAWCCLVLAYGLDSIVMYAIGLGLWAVGLYILPGYMTVFAVAFDSRVLLQPQLALRRVRRGGVTYLRAWCIALSAAMLSFLGIVCCGVGFAVSSVWFWHVAAFSFGWSFAHTEKLMHGGVQSSLGL